jgi:hypothetical protein
VDGELLPELAKLVGKEKEVHEITHKGISGEINWEQGLRERVDLLRGIPLEFCVSVSKGLPLMKGVREMAGKFREMNAVVDKDPGDVSTIEEEGFIEEARKAWWSLKHSMAEAQ